jgi:hypothetical protein
MYWAMERLRRSGSWRRMGDCSARSGWSTSIRMTGGRRSRSSSGAFSHFSFSERRADLAVPSRRASSQWFANLENVKDDAVKALESVNFFPSRGSSPFLPSAPILAQRCLFQALALSRCTSAAGPSGASPANAPGACPSPSSTPTLLPPLPVISNLSANPTSLPQTSTTSSLCSSRTAAGRTTGGAARLSSSLSRLSWRGVKRRVACGGKEPTQWTSGSTPAVRGRSSASSACGTTPQPPTPTYTSKAQTSIEAGSRAVC